MEFYGDLVMGTNTLSIGSTDPIGNESLDLTPTSSFLTPTPPQLHVYSEPLGDIRGYNPSLDPFCAYLAAVPRKIQWRPFLANTFDFSMAFSKFKRTLTLFAPSFAVLSYLHHSEMHASMYDKLVQNFVRFRTGG